MLWFVGLGMYVPGSIPQAAMRIIESADITYLDTFTSMGNPLPYPDMKPAPRWLVEDGREILENAHEKIVVLASYGDPMVATTHAELRVRAESRGISTGVIYAASATTSILGECGLHHYKAGRTATIMGDANAALTPYQTTYRNAVSGNHTILLLEYDAECEFFLDPADALRMMQNTEAGQRRGVFTGETYVVVASRVGAPDQAILAGRIDEMAGCGFGLPPHSIVVPGPLHFTERDALRTLARCASEPPPEGQSIKSISQQMMEKYSPAILDAARTIPDNTAYRTVVQNALLYVQDAQKALEEGHDEVAVLCMGYADGLVDALRIQLGLGEWAPPPDSADQK